jgi:hypothetical protein
MNSASLGAIREFQFPECTDLRSRVKRWPIDSIRGRAPGRIGAPGIIGFLNPIKV